VAGGRAPRQDLRLPLQPERKVHRVTWFDETPRTRRLLLKEEARLARDERLARWARAAQVKREYHRRKR
jgi:hypothetical protein